jgi:5-methylcytosine-specific restriction endonuclease McrA
MQDELKLFLAGALIQILGPRKRWVRPAVYGLLRLTTLQQHILWEREKMTRQLWLAVCNHFGWRCLRCGTVNWRNRERFKAKIEVDHVKPLAAWGLTAWGNLQTLCGPCNRAKGIRTADYRFC